MPVFRSLLAPGLLALATTFASPALAQTRGWLRYTDGNAVSGELVEPGRFRSDRFGELRFLPADARFEADATPPVVALAPSPAAPTTVTSFLAPTLWSVRLSGYWEEDDGSTTSDAAVDFEATWRRSAGELDLAVNTDFKVVDGDVDNNEQAARGRWFHDLSPSWFAVGLAKARRSRMTIDPMPAVDTLLLQGSLGLGARREWSLRSRSRVALGHDWITVDFLKYDLRFRTHATSFFLENNLQLSPRIRFNNTFYGYLWEDGSWGTDSDAEALYAINETLSVGLRHEYRHNTVDLDLGSYHKLSLTTRLSF
ncbi:MAG: DUF481 domain-containing protein [Rhizobacter sp.]